MKRRNRKVKSMSSRIMWQQFVRTAIHGAGSLYGPAIELPVEPFPGLRIGQLVVAKVSIMQGINGSENIIEYVPVIPNQSEELIRNGWRLISAGSDRKPQRPSRVAASA